ncbi:MAG: DUF2878 family protein, partial [Desulfobacterales bacterium]|nr:DUF2878 family protein [Desulfobacterales bacterium]MDX2510523.1 DUF2878 family protein [Desulfobacterales bacterium]
LLMAGIGFWLLHYRNPPDVAAMLAAAVLGTPSEMLCVKFGVWSYHAPGLILGIPVWIPLIWASLFCLFQHITLTMLDLADRRWPDPTTLSRRILFGILAALIIIYYLWVVISIAQSIAMVYSVIVLIGIVFWHKERDILIFIVGSILGTIGEAICMQLGFWQYQYPYFDTIGMPISLPMAWGLSAVIIGRIAKIWDSERSQIRKP